MPQYAKTGLELFQCIMHQAPDSKVHGANMGPIWDRQDPGGTHVGPMNFAIWGRSWPSLTYGMFTRWLL